MKYARIKATCKDNIQLRLLGGSVYLKSGEETTVVEAHLQHKTIQNALKNMELEIVEIFEKAEAKVERKAPVEEVIEAPAPKKAKAKKEEAVVEAPAPAWEVKEEAPSEEASKE